MNASTMVCSCGGECAAADAAAGGFVLAADGGELGQCGHHQPAVAEAVEFAGHLVGAAAQRPDHAAECGVARGGDLAGGGGLPGQFAQCVGEQRHGVSAGGVLDDPLDQAGVELESGPACWSGDDLAELGSAQRFDDQRVVDGLGQSHTFGGGAEVFRPDGGHRPERAVGVECAAQQVQECLLLVRAAAQQQFFGLVDGHQDFRSAMAGPGQVGEFVGQSHQPGGSGGQSPGDVVGRTW